MGLILLNYREITKNWWIKHKFLKNKGWVQQIYNKEF